jgi:hypothetical protein
MLANENKYRVSKISTIPAEAGSKSSAAFEGVSAKAAKSASKESGSATARKPSAMWRRNRSAVNSVAAKYRKQSKRQRKYRDITKQCESSGGVSWLKINICVALLAVSSAEIKRNRNSNEEAAAASINGDSAAMKAHG